MEKAEARKTFLNKMGEEKYSKLKRKRDVRVTSCSRDLSLDLLRFGHQRPRRWTLLGHSVAKIGRVEEFPTETLEIPFLKSICCI